VYGWLDLIRNDKLYGRRLERILRIEPDHEVKDFILEIADVVSATQGKGEEGRCMRRGDGAADQRG